MLVRLTQAFVVSCARQQGVLVSRSASKVKTRQRPGSRVGPENGNDLIHDDQPAITIFH